MSAVLLVEFLVFLRPFIPDRQEYNELIKYLEEIFHSCDESYKKSSDFKQLIQSTRLAIGNGKKNIHCYIAHLVSELQAHVKHSVERDDRSKSKKRHGDRNSGADSSEIPKEQVNRNKDGSDVRINLPNDGIISENNAGKEADSAIVAADDGKGHSSPQAADLSNLTLALRLVDLQPVKVDSVSAVKCADVHPEPTSTSYKESTDNPSCSKEQDFMSVVDGQNSAVSENGDSQREILLSVSALSIYHIVRV
ncbi:uncharacterized protein LOC135480682 [Liolophura sinensis]|uniref:uncharacterized protein LOC135480682 n=1 Tax=Liolophura sinensis TaxID=3198878 RepID=UPI003158772F